MYSQSTPKQHKQDNFVSGLQNARKLLDGLERSLSKTTKYEERLLRCKSTHAHSHDWCDSDVFGKESKCSESGGKTVTYLLIPMPQRLKMSLGLRCEMSPFVSFEITKFR